MKKLTNLKEAKALSKNEQLAINGGGTYCPRGGMHCNDGSWCCGRCYELGGSSFCKEY